ncbi:MAG TPA: TIR domain-containing protein, partial [Bacteroidales bacterium]|nr:TIR domain-containing protein [Bacteroidales bacterium]
MEAESGTGRCGEEFVDLEWWFMHGLPFSAIIKKKQTKKMNQENIYISYKWNNESQKVAEEIEEVLEGKKYQVIRDVSDVKYKGSISKFIERLGNSQFVVLVISDAYLKSKFCIQELLLLSKHHDFIDRVFPIILKDALIYEAESIIDYIEYWENKKANLENKLKNLDSIVKTKAISEDLDFYSDIRAKFDEAINFLRDLSTYDVSQDSYSKLVRAIENQMKINRGIAKEKNDWKLNLPTKKVDIDKISENKLIQGVTFLADKFNATSLTTNDLHQLYEVQERIFNPILQEFKLKVTSNTDLKEDFVNLLFNKITAYEEITDIDKEYLNFIRENDDFYWYEKKMLVSALTIGCLNKFDVKKINLLIDFSLSSEDKVWQAAFVGLILSLQLHKNKISSFPYLQRSLKRISESKELQDSLHQIALILRRKDYSAKAILEDESYFNEFISKMVLDFLPDGYLINEELTQTDVIDLVHYKRNNPDDEVINLIDVEALESDFKNGKREINIEDFNKYFNLKDYILKYEANPLALPYVDDKINPINWFLPFFQDKSLIKNFIYNLPDSVGDSKSFLEWLNKTSIINNIDKYCIICNVGKIDPVVFEVLNNFKDQEDILLMKHNVDYLKFKEIIRELYRFVLFFNDRTYKRLFNGEIELSDEEILKYVSDDLILKKLKGFALFEKGKIEEAKVELLDFHLANGNDLDVIQTLISIETQQNNYDKVIELCNMKINLLSSDYQRKEIYNAYYEIFNALKAQEQYDKALSNLMKMQQLFHLHEKECAEIGEINLERGLIYSLKGEGEKAILFHLKSFFILKQHKHKWLLTAQFNIFV